MWKVKRRIKTSSEEQDIDSVYDKYLAEASKQFMGALFALSVLQKVTAKQLAKTFSSKNVAKFASDFNDALNAQAEKVEQELEESLNKKTKKK